VKAALAQVIHDPLSNDAQAYYSDILSGSTRHCLKRGYAGNLPAGRGKITANHSGRNTEIGRRYLKASSDK
jgi:hypothetical protein